MSEITINIIDNSRTISGYAHGSFGDELVATLAAEPETIAELEEAFQRFSGQDPNYNPFGWFYEGFDPEPYDAGILVIDLAARLIACESTYSYPGTEGTISIRMDENGERFPLRYKLSDEWDFIRGLPEYEARAADRRRERCARQKLDVRSVLYGDPLFEFLIAESELNRANDDEDLLADIHAKWLMTPRADLDGRTPRELLLERRDFIEHDLQSRALQWSFTKECPPPLSIDSDAFKFAGFGTNEIVVYYDFVRDLAVAAISDEKADVGTLREFAADWLRRGQPELSDRVPAEIIESERRRINLTASPLEYIIDDDCEICRMMAAEFDTPMFWHLDGCNMEERFEFSFFATRDEWEEDRRQFEQFNIEFEKKYRTTGVFESEPF
ncbi:MAG: hypothetical protein IPK58_09145 [Acidobacteria bacterium]|nr:hypothetical protein [Acidobacteriota bacterium]